MLSKFSTSAIRQNSLIKHSVRNFGAMGEMDKSLFEHSFTSEMTFRDKFDKIKCFRVMDEEGNIVTPGYAEKISDELLVKMYDKMVMINEADVVYNAAQR